MNAERQNQEYSQQQQQQQQRPQRCRRRPFSSTAVALAGILVTALVQYRSMLLSLQLSLPSNDDRMDVALSDWGAASLSPGTSPHGNTISSGGVRGDDLSDYNVIDDIDRYFLTADDVEKSEEFFSAMWWQTLEDFMALNLDDLKAIEDSSFSAFATGASSDKQPWSRVRMTVDWLDLSVEHLSKYWRFFELDFENESKSQKLLLYKQIRNRLDEYMARTTATTTAGLGARGLNSTWRTSWGQQEGATIATKTIALVTHASGSKPLDRQMGYAAAVCTLLSLWQIGIPRAIFVVTPEATVQEKEQLVENVVREVYNRTNRVRSANVMEVVVATGVGNMSDDMTIFDEYNIAKGAFRGLQKAFSEANQNGEEHRKRWLGDNYYEGQYEYVYFTESDTILHTRPRALSLFAKQLQLGRILTAHRLQPLPHQVSQTRRMRSHCDVSSGSFDSCLLSLSYTDFLHPTVTI